VPYLNNIVEQDNRAIKWRVRASQGFRCFASAVWAIEGIEMIHMIRKGQVRWLPKKNFVGKVRLVTQLFGLSSAA
jgi:putative transposase